MTKSKRGINAYLTTAAVLIGAGSISTMASDRNISYLEACRPEVNQHYGQDMDISLVSKRRIPAGIQVKVAAKTDEDNAAFLNCWIPNNDGADDGFRPHSNAVAVTVKPVLAIE